MFDHIGVAIVVRRIRYGILVIAAVALCGSACIRNVKLSERLPVNAPLTTDQLIARINAYSEIKTFSAQVENVVVRNYFTGDKTKAEEFPAASGLLRFQRPENTRMRVTGFGKKVADMVSDGQKFRLAIFYPSDKRRFITGSNLKDIERMNNAEIHEQKDAQLARAGGLVNMRPQHITDSFLIKPISDTERNDVFREEVPVVEPDTRPGKQNRMAEKIYYVVYVIERNDKGQAHLRRKFWFDRTQQDTPLVRQQTFENGDGRLASDVTYSDWFTPPNNHRQWPRHIVIDRRNDGYRLFLELEKTSIETNIDLPDPTFKLENDEHMKEVDLDAPRKDAQPKDEPQTAPADKPVRPPNANRPLN